MVKKFNKVNIAKTNKPQDKCNLESKNKIQVLELSINRKSKKNMERLKVKIVKCIKRKQNKKQKVKKIKNKMCSSDNDHMN